MGSGHRHMSRGVTTICLTGWASRLHFLIQSSKEAHKTHFPGRTLRPGGNNLPKARQELLCRRQNLNPKFLIGSPSLSTAPCCLGKWASNPTGWGKPVFSKKRDPWHLEPHLCHHAFCSKSLFFFFSFITEAALPLFKSQDLYQSPGHADTKKNTIVTAMARGTSACW